MVLYWLLFAVQVLSIRLCLIWPADLIPANPREIELQLETFLSARDLPMYTVRCIGQSFPGDLKELAEFEPDVAVDYSTEVFAAKLNVEAMTAGQYYYVKKDLLLANPLAQPLKSDFEILEKLANSFVSVFGWDQAYLVEQDAWDLQEDHPDLEGIFLSSGLSQTNYDVFASREIRVSGVRALLVLADEFTTNSLLTSFAKFEMNEGYAIILLGTNCLFDTSIYPTGILCVSIAGLENSASTLEVDFGYIFYALTSRPLTWTILNVIEGIKYPCGTFEEDTLSLSPSIVFPGGLTSVDWSAPFPLAVNQNEYYFEPIFSQRSTEWAFEQLKLENKNFIVKPLRVFQCKAIMDFDRFINCHIKMKIARNLAFLSAEFDGSIVYHLEFMKATGLMQPYVNSESVIELLSSSDVYPNFVRLTKRASELILHLLLLNIDLNYDEILFLISLSIEETSVEISINNFTNKGIKVVNPEKFRYLMIEDSEYMALLAEYIKSTELRPLILFSPAKDNSVLMRALYDVGLRREDLMIITIFTTFQEIIDYATTLEEKAKIEEFRTCTISLAITSFLGSHGEQLLKEYKLKYDSVYFTDCLNYDLVNQVVLALNFTLRRGLNIFDWEQLITAMKEVRFTGCSGGVRFSKENNDRVNIDMDSTQAKEVNGKLEQVKVLRTSLTGQNFFWDGSFEWPDGTSTPPKQFRLNYEDCPFAEEHRRNSPKGGNIAAAVDWTIVGLTIIVSAIVWLCTQGPFYDSTAVIILSTQDILVYLSSLLDVIWLDFVSPGQSVIYEVLGLIFSQLQMKDLSDGVFYSLLRTTYIFAGISLAILLAVFLRKYKPFKIDLHIAAYVLHRPIYFLVVFALMTTFDCSEADSASEDPSLTDSFLDVDCYEYCWKDTHVNYAVTSMIMLAAYVLLPTMIASSLTNELEGLQIEANPRHLVAKQSFIVTLIALHKTKHLIPSPIDSLLFLATYGSYTLLCMRIKVVSIPSLSTAHNALLGVFFAMYVSVFFHKEAYPSLPLWISFGVAFALCVAVYSLVQIKKYPKRIENPTGIDTAVLFKFAFRPGKISDYFRTNGGKLVASSQKYLVD